MRKEKEKLTNLLRSSASSEKMVAQNEQPRAQTEAVIY